MAVRNMFDIPVFQIQCYNWGHKKQQLLDIVGNLGRHRFVYTDYHQLPTLDYTEQVHQILSDEIYQFSNVFNLKEVRVKRAWFERAEQHDYHHVHSHGSTGFSAVCYINYDKTEHTPTCFIAPFKNWLTGTDLVYVPEVDQGTVLFFPSAIMHYTEANQSVKTRTIVSFNLQC